MKKVLFFGFLLLFLILIISACTKSVQPPQQVQVQENITEVRVIASCDDNNNCTEDVFNNLTQQCEHTRGDHCCGDRVCDIPERCDQTTHKTNCPSDCPRECPA